MLVMTFSEARQNFATALDSSNTRYTRKNARHKGIRQEVIRQYVLNSRQHTTAYKRANLLFFYDTTKTFFTFVQLFVT